METTSRLFLCAGCRMQVYICSHCDRGQIYCANGCSQTARHQSLRAASHRYQQGRLKHAERVRRYRCHQHKVTHQGSEFTDRHGLLLANSTEVEESAVLNRKPTLSGLIRCHFCGGNCSAFVRFIFLGRRRVPNIVQVDRREAKHDYSP